MTFDVKAQLLIDLGNWQSGLNKATKQMTGFGKSMKTISNGVKAAWAGVALVGISSVYDAIVDVTKAAAEDNRSMALLNEQMKRTWGGNDKLNKSIDKQIDAMSNATGIADDKLRPALIRIAAVTKKPWKGMKMLSLATDISAKSGQDLSLVSRNMAKFLGGNKTALDKLVPGLSSASDRMKFLTTNYEGFAEIAGKNDPFARINVVMDNFKEKLGKAFLPVANNIADWLAGDEAQKALDALAKRVQDTFAWLQSPEAAKMFKTWYNNAKKLLDTVMAMVDGLAAFLASMPGGKSKVQTAWEERNQKKIDKYGQPQGFKPGGDTVFQKDKQGNYFSGTTIGQPYFTAGQRNEVNIPKGNTTINVYGMLSGQEVISELGKLSRKKGIPISKLFG